MKGYSNYIKMAECHVCGEATNCNYYVADTPEAETGYVDEYAICDQCAQEQMEE